MHLYALVILACAANGTCAPQLVKPGLSHAACTAELLHADPKLACEMEKQVALRGHQLAAQEADSSVQPTAGSGGL